MGDSMNLELESLTLKGVNSGDDLLVSGKAELLVDLGLVSTSGQEVGSAVNTALVSRSSASGVDIAGLSIPVPATTRPVKISYGGTPYSGTSGGTVILLVAVDGVAVDSRRFVSPATNGLGNIAGMYRLAPSASARVVTLQIAAAGGVANLQGQVATQQTYLHAVFC